MTGYKGIAIYGGVLALSLAVFWFIPSVDLWISGFFYNSAARDFPLGDWAALRALEGSVRWVAWGIAVFVALAAIWLRLVRRPLWRFDRNALIFLVAATVIGPGIVVNTVLKDHWGRARPHQVEEFGGSSHFTAAPALADQCPSNCSFVSGHAALAFSLIAFALLMPPGRPRRFVVLAVFGYGALVGLARIASGGHFLSDTVDAALIVVATTWLLHRWLVVYDGATPIIDGIGRLRETENGRRKLWAGGIVLFEIVALIWVDRPLAEFFHGQNGQVRAFFEAVQQFGLGWPYLVASSSGFLVLRYAGGWERLRRWDLRMRRAAVVPGFIFASMAGTGLVVDALKVLAGRARPKLLSTLGAHNFDWLVFRADHWSFPSGHASTAAALMTALWCLWPRPLWLYVVGAAMVAFARVVTGQHYLSDVVAGAVIAVLVTRGLALWLLPARAEVGVEVEAARGYPAE